MKIATGKHGDVCVIEVDGELKFGKPTEQLLLEVSRCIEAGERLFVLDLSRSPWLDSSGIGTVVEAYKRARRERGVVKLVLRSKARSLFTFVHLDKMFEIFDALPSALASFAGPDGGYRETFSPHFSQGCG